MSSLIWFFKNSEKWEIWILWMLFFVSFWKIPIVHGAKSIKQKKMVWFLVFSIYSIYFSPWTFPYKPRQNNLEKKENIFYRKKIWKERKYAFPLEHTFNFRFIFFNYFRFSLCKFLNFQRNYFYPWNGLNNCKRVKTKKKLREREKQQFSRKTKTIL